MNSPPEPSSPSPTTPSSGSPPPDEIILPPSSSSQVEPITSGYSHNSSGAKRQRNPSAYTTRDAKSRRRDDFGLGPSSSGPSRRAGQGYGGAGAGGQDMNRQKEELVDIPLAEALKRQFGDPFDDTILKRSA